LAAALILVASGVSQAAISGSKHDLRTPLSINEICITCHAPHNPDPGDQPLWNHALSSTSGYTMYPTTLSGGSPDTVPNANSLMCMGCHDGVTALDSFGGTTGGTVLTGSAAIGKDLSDDHPISITPTATDISVPAGQLYGGKIECGSCHDPHNDATSPVDFLRISNTNSDLCLDCHDK
jgi:predicted CXXCH cytochrome family protein